MVKVMVFGTFDGIHEGHRAMFKEAKKHGDYLIAVVAQNHIVQHLKGYLPKLDLAERIAHLEAEDGVDEVVIGDAKLGTWEVVKKYRPDVIACGYDQNDLKKDLEANLPKLGYNPRVVLLSAYEPNVYHSRFAR
jgi:cytidyltransferase-like protein